MNNFQKFSFVLGCFFLAQNNFVNSQQSVPSLSEQLQRLQQKQEQKETEESLSPSKQTQETVRMSPYVYRSQANPTTGYYPGYQRDLYQAVSSPSSPVVAPKGNLIQMATGGDYFITAHINQIFYSFVGISCGVALIIFVIKYLLHAFDISGMYQKFKNGGSSATAKSLDLNRITDIVYGAIDNYGKMADKDDNQSKDN